MIDVSIDNVKKTDSKFPKILHFWHLPVGINLSFMLRYEICHNHIDFIETVQFKGTEQEKSDED